MPEFLFLSFEEFSKYCFELAVKIKQTYQGKKIDYLISVQRGGALMSKILSDVLEAPIATVVVSSYQDLAQVKKPFVSQEISVDIQGKNVVVLDEICDTGDTLRLVREYLSQRSPTSVTTAVLIVKPKATFRPDLSAAESEKWVVFPGELRETARALNSLSGVAPAVIDEFNEFATRHGASAQLLQALELQMPQKNTPTAS